MKKIFKIVLFVVGVLCVGTFTFFIVTYERPKKLSILVSPHEYIIANTVDSTSFSVPLYLNVDESIYMDKDMIVHSYIKSVDGTQSYYVIINDIKLKEEVLYKDRPYYLYKIDLEFPFSTTDLIKIDQAYLEFNYSNEELLSFNIGSICLYNYKDTSNICYTSLKGITIDKENKKMLMGVLVNIEAESNYIIKNIIPLSVNAKIDFYNTTAINYINEEETPIKEYLVDNYQIIGDGGGNKDIYMNSDNHLLIYLKYDTYIECPVIGFIVEYEIDGITNNLVISPFQFYSSFKDIKILEEINYECH